MSEGSTMCKKFLTEAEVEELKKKRQEEWEKVRNPDDPEGEYTYFKLLIYILLSSSQLQLYFRLASHSNYKNRVEEFTHLVQCTKYIFFHPQSCIFFHPQTTWEII